MAHKKGEGKVKNGRDSHSKRLGIKIYGGQVAESGNIIIRQRGTAYHPGKGVMLGKDDHETMACEQSVVSMPVADQRAVRRGIVEGAAVSSS